MTFRLTRICLLVLLLSSCKKKVEKVLPSEEKIIESVYASGVIKARDQYQVFSTVNGLISEIMVKENDSVGPGTPLIRLVNTAARLTAENARLAADYAAGSSNQDKLEELKLSIDLARAKMDNDASLLERQRNLWSGNIGTKNELDQRELALKNSTQAYDAAKLRYSQLQRQISFQDKQSRKNLQISNTLSSDFIIRSEQRGRVYSLLKEKGELVTPQQPVAVIGDARSFYLELQVDEYDIARIMPGQKIVLSMDSHKGVVFEAVVDKIYPLMNERSKSFKVDASFVSQPPSLFPNLTCEANIIIHEKDKALTIPRSCLLEGDMVILENKEKRKVTTGLKDYQKVEIISGLRATDVILKPQE